MRKSSGAVLIITNSDAGLYKFRKELIAELISQNKQVYLALPEGMFRKELEAMGCRYLAVDMERHGINPFAELILLGRYIKIIRAVRPAAVLTYTIKPNIYGNLVCRFFRIPSAANITGLGTAVEKKGLLQFITVTLYKIAFGRVSCVFFQNRPNQSFFEKCGIPIRKSVLLPGSGVNLDDFAYLDYPDGPAEEFLFEGRIMKEKGIEQFLDVARHMRVVRPNSRFTIIGTFEEPEYEPVIRELHELGIVNFEGARADVHPYLARCCCVIHPTYYPEGMSNVLLEAAASGRPVITTGRSGCREIVDDEVTGYIAKEKDSVSFIEKVETFLSLPPTQRAVMGRKAREKVAGEFDRKIVIKSYIDELTQMINEK